MSEARKSAVAYLVAVGLCLVSLTWVLKLWRADLAVPFVYGSERAARPVLDQGPGRERLVPDQRIGRGPFGLEMHDFPMSDGLFFVTLKALSWVARDYVRTMNVYFFLTFPLAAVSALFVFRHFGTPRGPAVVAGVLFAMLPYHFIRGQEHLFLASYFLVPLAVMLALRVYLDDKPVFRGLRDRRTWAALALCLLIGSGGVYMPSSRASCSWSAGRARPAGGGWGGGGVGVGCDHSAKPVSRSRSSRPPCW